jgi:hypothetical protein
MEWCNRLIKKIISGQSLVEVLVAMGISALVIPAIYFGLIASRQGQTQMVQRKTALTLLNESIEVVREVREKDWTGFAVDGTFHPSTASGAWILASGPETLGSFTRSIVISDVYRDNTGKIITSGGLLDPSSKKVDYSVSWSQPSVSSVTTSAYFTRFRDNLAYTQTSVADFNTGTKTNTAVTNNAGGEISLAQNTRARWCSPALSDSSINLPDGPPVAVAAFADPVTVNNPNKVFVATSPTATNSAKLAYINVTANTDSPTSTLRGTFTLDSAKYSNPAYVPTNIGLDNSFITNDVKYYSSPAGKLYALLATTKPDKEVIAIQINDGTSDTFQDPVNKIYKYWTFFNTKIYGSSYNNPSANSADTGGDNDGYQTNPTYAYNYDGSFAVDTNSGSNTGTSCTGNDKDKHRFYNYNFSIPSGATINGIGVNLAAKVDSTTGSPKICVQLSWDGGTTWTATQSTANLTTSVALYSLGGVADTWGHAWTDTGFSNANFRVRVADVASNTSRDFSLDWVGVKVYYNGVSSASNDQAPFNYGASAITILGSTGYVDSGGYLYAFDLSNIDSKSTSNDLDQVGCRILLDGYDCLPGSGTDKKYAAGETGASWSDTTSPAHNDCSDGGNIEINADHQLSAVQVGANKYVYAAVGAGTNPELDIVDVSTPPASLSNYSCGRGSDTGWKVTGSLDLDTYSGTEEAANSVYAKSDGTRAYVSSNGGILHNNIPDSDQFYVIDTSTKSSPKFLTSWASTQLNPPAPTPAHYQGTAQSGYYNGDTNNIELYPRRALTVLNGLRAVLVGQDGVSDNKEPQEYQVLNIDNESVPTYCGGVNYVPGFNDLTSVSEADGDNFVYMVANTMDHQLKIIQGGPDGNYNDPGTFESGTYDPGYQIAFNRFTANVTLPANTNIQLQVGVAQPVNNSCAGANFTYVGPGGDTGAFYTPIAASISGTIPWGNFAPNYTNPGRCFRYKATLYSNPDFSQTPSLNDFTVNFSP